MVIVPCYLKALFEMGNCLTEPGEHEEARVRFWTGCPDRPCIKRPSLKNETNLF